MSAALSTFTYWSGIYIGLDDTPKHTKLPFPHVSLLDGPAEASFQQSLLFLMTACDGCSGTAALEHC